MSQVTTHILDTSKGKPAEGITIVLYQQHADGWKEIVIGTTNSDGRIPHFLSKDAKLEPGIYKMTFDTQPYFEKQAILTFYPLVEISFHIRNSDHYHIPLLLSPFGYSTYRGS
jgi:5-hydroxyisourate hydrolase